MKVGTIISQYFDTKIISNELLQPKGSPKWDNSGLAEAIQNHIRQNYRYPLSTKQLADAFYVNASYASRCFSIRFNTTITEYISKIRTDHAKILLTTTNAPIGSIALNVGFDDANYFARVFKKIVGMSPLQYRKSQKH